MRLSLHSENKIALFRALRVPVVFLLAFASIPCARAQPPQIDALAARVAEELSKKHEKTVVVFDFVGPDKKSTALGQKIADDFCDALKKSSPSFSILGRSQIAQALEENRLSPQMPNDPELKLWFAKKLGVELMVLGTIESDGESLHIAVNSYTVKDGKALKEFKVAAPRSEQVKSLMDTPADTGEDQSASLPKGGTSGYSAPACIHCPAANIPAKLSNSQLEGTVVLEVVVGADGEAHDIAVVKMLPHGLTESAIEAVQSWRFKPATGPDGALASVKTTIEVTFKLYYEQH
jgi:TonB family protein